jgi:hypothetical protein
MKEQAEKLKEVESELSAEKGAFSLFGLFLREDAPGKWDLLISADWALNNKKEAMNLILSAIKKVLSDQELLMLSRLIIMNEDDPALSALQGAINVEHGMAEIQDSNFFGLKIKHAYLITSKKKA